MKLWHAIVACAFLSSATAMSQTIRITKRFTVGRLPATPTTVSDLLTDGFVKPEKFSPIDADGKQVPLDSKTYHIEGVVLKMDAASPPTNVKVAWNKAGVLRIGDRDIELIVDRGASALAANLQAIAASFKSTNTDPVNHTESTSYFRHRSETPGAFEAIPEENGETLFAVEFLVNEAETPATLVVGEAKLTLTSVDVDPRFAGIKARDAAIYEASLLEGKRPLGRGCFFGVGPIQVDPSINLWGRPFLECSSRWPVEIGLLSIDNAKGLERDEKGRIREGETNFWSNPEFHGCPDPKLLIHGFHVEPGSVMVQVTLDRRSNPWIIQNLRASSPSGAFLLRDHENRPHVYRGTVCRRDNRVYVRYSTTKPIRKIEDVLSTLDVDDQRAWPVVLLFIVPEGTQLDALDAYGMELFRFDPPFVTKP